MQGRTVGEEDMNILKNRMQRTDASETNRDWEKARPYRSNPSLSDSGNMDL